VFVSMIDKRNVCVIQRKTGDVLFLTNNIVEVAGNSEEQIAARKAVSERRKAIFLSKVGPET